MPNIYDLVAEEIDGLVAVQYSLPAFQRIRAWLAAIKDIKPDWRQAPTWAQWWALQDSGRIYWFESEPFLYKTFDGREYWNVPGGTQWLAAEVVGYRTNWKDTKRCRPLESLQIETGDLHGDH